MLIVMLLSILIKILCQIRKIDFAVNEWIVFLSKKKNEKRL